jgi:hypothetical protein
MRLRDVIYGLLMTLVSVPLFAQQQGTPTLDETWEWILEQVPHLGYQEYEPPGVTRTLHTIRYSIARTGKCAIAIKQTVTTNPHSFYEGTSTTTFSLSSMTTNIDVEAFEGFGWDMPKDGPYVSVSFHAVRGKPVTLELPNGSTRSYSGAGIVLRDATMAARLARAFANAIRLCPSPF